jgi:hypothetical protein
MSIKSCAIAAIHVLGVLWVLLTADGFAAWPIGLPCPPPPPPPVRLHHVRASALAALDVPGSRAIPFVGTCRSVDEGRVSGRA